MPAVVHMGISHTSWIIAEWQKLPRLPGDAWKWNTVGDLWRAWSASSGMYGNLCLENSAGKWWQESSVRPKAGQRMASLHVPVEHGKNTQGSQEGSECSGGWLSLSCVSGEDTLPSRRGNSISRRPGVGGGGQELKPELILTSTDCSGWI